METVLREAQDAAQAACKAWVDYICKHGRQSAALASIWTAAERWVDDIEAGMQVAEWRLDAAHEGNWLALEDYRIADGLPDVPQAAITEGELRALHGDR